MTLGMMFPGQGSQSVGMLAELASSRDEVKQTLEEANDALGINLSDMMLNGPEADLNRTQNTQPAVLVGAVSIWRVWQAMGGPQPTLLAGHSVGEFTALVCAGALPFAQAVNFVAERGRAMQEAVPEGVGAVAAVLGLDDDAVAAACESAAQGDVVSPVNFNAPGQVVIAGHAQAVERALAAAKEAGAKKTMLLPVSVPVHCALMRAPGERLLPSIAALDLSAPNIPIVHNVDVSTHASPEEIRAVLEPHVYSPVPWAKTVQAMAGQGVNTLVECGAGRVLAGLARRIDRSLATHAVYDTPSLEKTLAALAESSNG
jgi:[acyl-carrier-protein] S-malonyltransferase